MKKTKLGNYIQEYSVKNKQGKEYPVYSVTNSNGFCTEYFNKDVSSKDKRNYKIVPYGCFAYNPSRINVGSIDWQHYEKNVIVSPLYVVFKCSNEINQKYLQYFFESEYGKHLINSKVSGSVRSNLKFSAMCEFELNIGTIEEQQKTIYTLDKINNLIEKEKQQLEKLDELIKSKFNEMFGDINNREKFEHTKWTTVVSITNGKDHKHISGSGNYAVYGTGGKMLNCKEYMCEPGTIIMGRKGTIDKPYIVYEKCWIVDTAFGVNSKSSILNNTYLFYYIKQIDFVKLNKMATLPSVTKNDLLNLDINIPPIQLQNKFAEFVKKVDNLKMNIQKQIDLYTELLNKKMDEYFN